MIDPVLARFVSTQDERAAADELALLLDKEAAPVIARVLQKRAAHDRDVSELTSATREEVIARLLELRESPKTNTIRNFRGYVSAIAYTVWARQLREKHPARAQLLNRLRYLLENRGGRSDFALWTNASGEQWAGFSRWRDQPDVPRVSPKSQWLAVDPEAAGREGIGARHWTGMELSDVVHALFAWVDGPLEFKALLEAVGALLQVRDEQVAIVTSDEEEAIVRAASSPVDAVKWQEYLRWLWQTIGTLSLPQRSAFLLHSEVTVEFDFRGVASLRQIAAALEISPEEFAALWNSIPLDDLTIAARLGRERQQVINLRRVARDRLGAQWKEWIGS